MVEFGGAIASDNMPGDDWWPLARTQSAVAHIKGTWMD